MCGGGMMEVLFMHKNKNIPNVFINIFTINTTLSHVTALFTNPSQNKKLSFFYVLRALYIDHSFPLPYNKSFKTKTKQICLFLESAYI